MSNMNSFWSQLYDRHKDRRYANLFFFTLFGFIGLIVPGVIIVMRVGSLDLHLLYLLPGIVMLLTAIVWRAIRRSRTKRRTSTFPQLSRDELRKAQSKLLKERQRHERSMHFGSSGNRGMAGIQRGGGGGGDFARLPGRQ